MKKTKNLTLREFRQYWKKVVIFLFVVLALWFVYSMNKELNVTKNDYYVIQTSRGPITFVFDNFSKVYFKEVSFFKCKGDFCWIEFSQIGFKIKVSDGDVQSYITTKFPDSKKGVAYVGKEDGNPIQCFVETKVFFSRDRKSPDD